jgi:hypothetical protein
MTKKEKEAISEYYRKLGKKSAKARRKKILKNLKIK